MCPPENGAAHGGHEHRHYLFTRTDIAVMEDLRKAFNPDGRCSPHKMLPTAGGCGMEHIERDGTGKRAAV